MTTSPYGTAAKLRTVALISTAALVALALVGCAKSKQETGDDNKAPDTRLENQVLPVEVASFWQGIWEVGPSYEEFDAIAHNDEEVHLVGGLSELKISPVGGQLFLSANNTSPWPLSDWNRLAMYQGVDFARQYACKGSQTENCLPQRVHEFCKRPAGCYVAEFQSRHEKGGDVFHHAIFLDALPSGATGFSNKCRTTKCFTIDLFCRNAECTQPFSVGENGIKIEADIPVIHKGSGHVHPR